MRARDPVGRKAGEVGRGPGDDDEDVTPVGDPEDDEDWDGDDEDDDEEPLQVRGPRSAHTLRRNTIFRIEV